MSDHDSKPVVVAALLANVTIGALKFGAFLLTGSAAMLAEVYHSASDTGNQVLLLIGLSRSTRGPTRTHPFGTGKAQFVAGFLVSILLFGVAGWRSVTEGYHALTHLDAASVTAPAALGGLVPGIAVSYAVLGGVLVCEGWSWRKAYRTLADEIDAHGWDGITDAFRCTSDTATLTTFTEDTIAVGGAGIALLGITLSQVTGNPVYDATAALAIGLLLMGGGLLVAWVNSRLLIGKSLPPDTERRLYDVVADRATVADVTEFRTVHFGPEHVVIGARVAFSDSPDTDLPDRIDAIKADLTEAHPGVSTVYLTPDHPDTHPEHESDDTERRATPI